MYPFIIYFFPRSGRSLNTHSDVWRSYLAWDLLGQNKCLTLASYNLIHLHTIIPNRMSYSMPLHRNFVALTLTGDFANSPSYRNFSTSLSRAILRVRFQNTSSRNSFFIHYSFWQLRPFQLLSNRSFHTQNFCTLKLLKFKSSPGTFTRYCVYFMNTH